MTDKELQYWKDRATVAEESFYRRDELLTRLEAALREILYTQRADDARKIAERVLGK